MSKDVSERTKRLLSRFVIDPNEKCIMGCQAELHIIEFYQPGFGFVKQFFICFAELRHVLSI